MPYKFTKYKCSICHKEFNSYSDAYDHEILHHDCSICDHGYYVYGCEFACDYFKECKPPEYKKFKRKQYD